MKTRTLTVISLPSRRDDIYCPRVCLSVWLGCVWRERTARNFTIDLLRVSLTAGCCTSTVLSSLSPSYIRIIW